MAGPNTALATQGESAEIATPQTDTARDLHTPSPWTAGRPKLEALPLSVWVSEPSVAIEDILWELYADFVDHDPRAALFINQLQQRIVDTVAGFEINARTFHELRQRPEAQAYNPNGIPDVRVEGLRTLPGLTCLTKVQEGLIGHLSRHEPEALLPLAWLYFDLYRHQAGPRGRFWLAKPTRAMVIELGQAHMHRGAQAQDDILDLWIALGHHQASLGEYHAGLEALELFRRVIGWDPSNTIARYWSAYLAEKYGFYRNATKDLERLVDAKPNDHESRLRLAVNQLRTGNATPGLTTLRSMAPNSDLPEWLRILAYEELVRALGPVDSVEALRWAHESTEAFPLQPSLHVQLAHLQRHDWSSSVAALETAEGLWQHIDSDTPPSPRVLYEGPREGPVTVVRERFEQRADTRRPQLARALEAQVLLWKEDGRPVIDACYRAILRTE